MIGRVSASANGSIPLREYRAPGTGNRTLTAPAPQAADRKPDLSGLWQPPANPCPRRPGLEMGHHLEDFMRLGEKTPPQLPAVEALYRKRQAQSDGGPALKTFAVCHPGRDAHRCAAQDPGLTLIL
ncbi:MAG: hypothetical protein KGM92_20510 [Acidobacteriota bacterium]|nr:hypothetical protein [Acidobacteriota bacterium]